MARWLNARRIRFVSLSVLAVTAVLLAVSFITGRTGRTVFGTELGSDYAAFYTAGKIQNDYGAARLYDRRLQDRLYHELRPQASSEEALPYANAPFLAPLFRPLALLPYGLSYFVWLCLSLGLYAAGLTLVLRTTAVPAAMRTAVWLLALSFEPFLMECWVGGQLSAIGFLLLALTIYWLPRNRPVAAGVSLAVCLYKPTLLILLLPMLVVSRRWKILLGFAGAALGLAIFSLVAVGQTACLDYARLLTAYVHAAAGSAEIFRIWKFVDLVSFFHLLQGGHTLTGWCAMGVIGVAAAGFVLPRWWRGEGEPLVWAGTITATLVLNLYVGIYDATLAVLGALLTVDALMRRGPISPGFRLLLLLLYVVPWFSQPLARVTGLQLYTLVLAGCAVYELRLADRREPPAPDAVR